MSSVATDYVQRSCTMDLQSLLRPFFENVAIYLSGQSLVAATLARMIHGALEEAGFDPGRASEQLGKLGFKVGRTLLSELIDAAKTGVRALTKWLEAKLADSVEVNEAASRTLVGQAQPIATAVRETRAEERDEVANAMQEGLRAYGGAAAEIAEPFAKFLKDQSLVEALVLEMSQRIDSWATQTVEAKRGSLIENVQQTIEDGTQGRQEVRAEDESTINGVRQVISNKSGSKGN